MTPELWKRSQEIFSTALEREPAARAEFLDKACSGDAELRREVESLLASHEEASSRFLESPAFVAMESVALPYDRRPVTPATRLGPYEILAPLGVGGMGEVYRARDSKLKREVAIKVLPKAVAHDADALARFEREAFAVAALSHPNILAIHDFGNQGGTTYAVMELLEGETLRGKLDAGPIAQKQAVDYALQIAKGLSAAHERGVVHRDLKPENVFVSKDGHVKILDFGLAKKVEPVVPGKETSAPTASGHTEPGTVMGTVGYMSPEQVRGQPVDHRSDIFSFGAVLYELLSGKRAFKKDTAADTMSAILKEEPPELTGSGRNISPALDHIVRHCLEKDRDDRFQSAKDIAFALGETSSLPIASGVQTAAPPTGKRTVLVSAAALVVLVVGGLFLLRRFHPGAAGAGSVKRVAVLPFENLGSPEDDYFADGIADAVRGKLTSLSGVQVIARASSTPYKKSPKKPKEIADELGVGYLLTATVRWQKAAGGSRVEVTPELVEMSSSGAPTSKWQQPFDAALTDVFQVQADIATRAAQALGVALGAGEEKRLSERPTQNIAAYDAYLRGKEALTDPGVGFTPAYKRSITFFEQAVALDPHFGEAWAGLTSAISWVYREFPTPDWASRGRAAADKALALAPNSPETCLALGNYYQWVRVDSKRAYEELARGHKLAPANAELLVGLGVAEGSLGLREDEIRHFRESERLDPRSTDPKLWLGVALMNRGRPEQAREVFDRGLAIAPANLTLIGWKALTWVAVGDLTRARRVFAEVPKEVEPTALAAHIATYGDNGWVLDDASRELLLRLPPSAFDEDRAAWAFALTQAYWWKGDRTNARVYAEEARKAFEERTRGAPQNAEGHAYLGLSLAYSGKKEKAIEEGKRALDLSPAEERSFSDAKLALIYILVAEEEKALDMIERFVKVGDITTGELKLNPNFDPLRKNPRFQKLVAGAK